jgi:FkbH-like protein
VKLIEALKLTRRPVPETARETTIFLACGFTPLHLQAFLTAEMRMRMPENRIAINTGLFGDLCGNIERIDLNGIDFLAVVVEWGDFDSRLALRTLGGWQPSQMGDILESATRTAARLKSGLTAASHSVPTIVCMPTLPLPPMFSCSLSQAGSAETQVRHIAASLAVSLSQESGIRLVNGQAMDEVSPFNGRYDLKSDVLTGLPYTLPHASAIGEALSTLIQNRPPKKGLITDLDDTLWSGILGEVGVEGISWHLDAHTQIHGLYQQFLASLAGAGVLIGVASKNDSTVVEQAFTRTDLLLSRDDVYPFEVHWSRKSESVERILKAWNIGADSVIFIDDSPMEVAEVKMAFPKMECLAFPKNDYDEFWKLLKHLRDVFGKSMLTADDAIRLRSIRDATAWRDASQSRETSHDDFLQATEASVFFESAQRDGDARAFELLNKTNQFNLNGKRFSESEWRRFLKDPAAFVLIVSYKDKFGSLGKIAVILGRTSGCVAHVSGWVMSCRAFSRRIEHQCLRYLFATLGADEIVFNYQPTPRNGPLQDFLAELLGVPPREGARLSREQFAARAPQLFHHVEGVVHV